MFFGRYRIPWLWSSNHQFTQIVMKEEERWHWNSLRACRSWKGVSRNKLTIREGSLSVISPEYLIESTILTTPYSIKSDSQCAYGQTSKKTIFRWGGGRGRREKDEPEVWIGNSLKISQSVSSWRVGCDSSYSSQIPTEEDQYFVTMKWRTRRKIKRVTTYQQLTNHKLVILEREIRPFQSKQSRLDLQQNRVRSKQEQLKA